jgi:hypothetical protein
MSILYETTDYELQDNNDGTFEIQYRESEITRYGIFYGWRRLGRKFTNLKNAERKFAKLIGSKPSHLYMLNKSF